MSKTSSIKIIAQNKKAHFNYFLSEFLECGISLVGTEIKSLRTNAPNITDSYIVFRNEEAEIVNMHIPVYKQGNIFNHDPYRARKLLIHKKEIRWYIQKSKAEGYTVVPTKIYFKNGKAKLEIALAKGKKLHDKRQVEKERDDKRLIEKSLKNF